FSDLKVNCCLAQVGWVHPDPERATALPRAPDRSNLLRRAHQLGTLNERSAHGQAMDDRSRTAVSGGSLQIGLDRAEQFGVPGWLKQRAELIQGLRWTLNRDQRD